VSAQRFELRFHHWGDAFEVQEQLFQKICGNFCPGLSLLLLMIEIDIGDNGILPIVLLFEIVDDDGLGTKLEEH
jgi:hypothetical protein